MRWDGFLPAYVYKKLAAVEATKDVKNQLIHRDVQKNSGSFKENTTGFIEINCGF
jgi:hypothetical protein